MCICACVRANTAGLPTAVQVRATNVWDGTVQPNVRLNLTARQVEPHGVQFFVLEPEH